MIFADFRSARQGPAREHPGQLPADERLVIGDPPAANAEAQMAAFRAVGSERVAKNWGDDDQLVHGSNGVEAAEKLVDVVRKSNVNAVNIRIFLKGLEPAQVRGQIERFGSEFIPHFRKIWNGAR